MDKAKKARLEADGWTVGSTQDFLGLSDEEMNYIEIKLLLAKAVANRRRKLHYSQTELARRLRSSQSRIAKMESGDPSVSVDLMVKSLLKMGVTRKKVGAVISRSMVRH